MGGFVLKFIDQRHHPRGIRIYKRTLEICERSIKSGFAAERNSFEKEMNAVEAAARAARVTSVRSWGLSPRTCGAGVHSPFSSQRPPRRPASSGQAGASSIYYIALTITSPRNRAPRSIDILLSPKTGG
jgi:hypothetical protein